MIRIADINFLNLKKDQLQKYLTGRCRHRHLYSEHPACFVAEQGLESKVGYLDIETSNLKANYGIMLSYAIKVKDKKEVLHGVIKKEELMDGTLDKRLVQDCINDLFTFDKVITYYGTRFDLPFIRSRALYWGLDFPLFGEVKHKDCYYIVKSKLQLHRNRLETACDLLGIKGKTHIEPTYWIKALTGDKKSLDYILEHNIADTEILEKLHKRLIVYVKDTNRSV